MREVTLREYETARVVESAPDQNELTVGDVAGLESAQRAAGVEAFSWAGRDRIRAGQFVGMVASDGARLEILPKIDGQDGGETRAALMRMLCTAIDINVSDGELTGHETQNRDLLELLIGLFAARLIEQVRRGLIRDYRRQNADLATLRGKLDIGAQFRRLAASPHRLACVYDEFTADTALNRLLLAAVLTLRRRSVLARNQRLLSEIESHFEDVAAVDPKSVLAAPIATDRRTQGWRTVERLARLLLSAMYQTTHGGLHAGVALLFDMNVLFERYVAAIARRCLTPLGYRVSAQQSGKHLARTLTGRPAFMTRPDLHLERGEEVVILDTKWKRINPTKPNCDVAQADAYQMRGYAEVYDASAAVLLYPFMRDVMSVSGPQSEWIFSRSQSRLKVVAVDVAMSGVAAQDIVAAVEFEDRTV